MLKKGNKIRLKGLIGSDWFEGIVTEEPYKPPFDKYTVRVTCYGEEMEVTCLERDLTLTKENGVT